MTALARLNDLDARVWSTATWSAPLMTNVLLALVIVASWLLGRLLPGSGAVVLFLMSAAAVLLVCAVMTTLLARSTSSRARGIALSVVGSYAVVLVGALVYGFWVLRW
jgi:hypothetical protein